MNVTFLRSAFYLHQKQIEKTHRYLFVAVWIWIIWYRIEFQNIKSASNRKTLGTLCFVCNLWKFQQYSTDYSIDCQLLNIYRKSWQQSKPMHNENYLTIFWNKYVDTHLQIVIGKFTMQMTWQSLVHPWQLCELNYLSGLHVHAPCSCHEPRAQWKGKIELSLLSHFKHLRRYPKYQYFAICNFENISIWKFCNPFDEFLWFSDILPMMIGFFVTIFFTL